MDALLLITIFVWAASGAWGFIISCREFTSLRLWEETSTYIMLIPAAFLGPILLLAALGANSARARRKR